MRKYIIIIITTILIVGAILIIDNQDILSQYGLLSFILTFIWCIVGVIDIYLFWNTFMTVKRTE